MRRGLGYFLLAPLVWCSLVITARSAAGSEGATASSSATFPPWRGHHDAIETALSHGEVVERARIGHGVTNPWKVTLEYAGERLEAVWKPLAEDDSAAHHESWRAEVAAYRLSRVLGLDVVPPTVPRTLSGEDGSLQLWVEGCRPYRDVEGQETSAGYPWVRHMDRMRLFDGVIDNGDRNAGNFLVTDRWDVVLIDHSRALSLQMRPHLLPPLASRFDRDLLERIRGLDDASLQPLLSDLYSPAEIGALLRHRDRVLKEVERSLRRGKAVLVTTASVEADL